MKRRPTKKLIQRPNKISGKIPSRLITAHGASLTSVLPLTPKPLSPRANDFWAMMSIPVIRPISNTVMIASKMLSTTIQQISIASGQKTNRWWQRRVGAFRSAPNPSNQNSQMIPTQSPIVHNTIEVGSPKEAAVARTTASL
ncbi:MAG: hypothetical protein ACYSPJ_01105 [Planctomycetota bacterium]